MVQFFWLTCSSYCTELYHALFAMMYNWNGYLPAAKCTDYNVIFKKILEAILSHEP